MVKYKIKCPSVSVLSIAFSDADLMLQFGLPYINMSLITIAYIK